jgi:glycosyltransferase involved in cell wall biosynthesis
MRLLYDISTLGLGHLSVESRGGSYRADLHITAGLIASGECDLLFCANHSSFACQGSIAYLREHPLLREVPLLGTGDTGTPSPVRRGLAAVHGAIRKIAGNNPLPGLVRRSGALIDRHVHPAVFDASPPVDIFHSPSARLPDRPRGRRSPKRFLTIYDLSYKRFTKLYDAAYRRVMDAAIASVLDGDWVMTSSESTRHELIENGVVPAHRIAVAPLAADPEIFYPCTDAGEMQGIRARYRIPAGPYILSVNSPDPRKNIAHAVRAFGHMVQQERVADLSLVLAGNSGPGSDQVHEAMRQFPELRDRIVVTGFVADHDLAALYSGATALVYPSIYEGFGLPPLEAMQCGTPVITTDKSSLPEVVGDAGVMVPADDLDALSGAMLELYRDAPLRESLRGKSLAQAARFSWHRSTQLTLKAYRAALES